MRMCTGCFENLHPTMVLFVTNSGRKPSDRSTKEERLLLRYGLFEAVCKILEVSCRPAERERLRQQRAALEKKLGYDQLDKNDLLGSISSKQASEAEIAAFTKRARRRLRAALNKKLQPGEKPRLPKF